MDIRFDNEPKKGQTPTTRLHMPNKETAEDFESRSERKPSRGRSASRAAEEPRNNYVCKPVNVARSVVPPWGHLHRLFVREPEEPQPRAESLRNAAKPRWGVPPR